MMVLNGSYLLWISVLLVVIQWEYGEARREHGWIRSTAQHLTSPSFSCFGVDQKIEAGSYQQTKHEKPGLVALRGGDQEQLTLDEKVHAAMKKLGLEPPPPIEVPAADDDALDENCKDGVCAMPESPSETPSKSPSLIDEENVVEAGERLAKSMNVDTSLAMAALGATSVNVENERKFDEEAARSMIQQELDMIDQIPPDSPQVHTLSGEGHDPFLVRRALAFAEGNIDDARAILIADKEDEEQARQKEEEEALSEQAASETVATAQDETKEEIFPTVTVDSKIDPTKISATGASEQTSGGEPPMPKPASKDEVVFEATSSQIQKLVLESPVPVLVDVYADWCGPCKALTPALEDMAIKSGGLFRLVKVNSDNERAVSGALEVTSLPTVFGVKDGNIINMFMGMPRSEDAMKSFMMGLLVGESNFDPPLTNEQRSKYKELTTKLVKMAGAASFSFSARERLQDRVSTQLEKLVEQVGNDVSKAQESASVVRSLLSNVIRNPSEEKFRTVKLSNAVMKAKIAPFPAALALLKSVGFQPSSDGDSNEILKLAPGKKFVNIAPLMVARDSIDKWVDTKRYEIAKAARKRKDEEERARLEAEGAFDEEEEDEEEDDSEKQNLDTCLLKVRVAGKKKVYNLSLAATDRLSNVVDQLQLGNQDNEIQITCVAKKLVVKSTDKEAMEDRTLKELGLAPTAALVVEVRNNGSEAGDEGDQNKSRLSERAAQRAAQKKGSHTMQSVGIYSKDDNAKAELIDGGGGVWYEHDVSDDEEERGESAEEDDSNEEDEDEAANAGEEDEEEDS